MIRRALYLGAIWNAVAQFGAQGINMAMFVVLAWYLSPADFGYFTALQVLLLITALFTELGFTTNILARKTIDRADEAAVFVSTLICTVVTAVALYLLAPVLAGWLLAPEHTQAVRVLIIALIATQLAFVPEALQRRQLRFDIVSKAELTSVVLSVPVALLGVWAGWGWWALIWQMMAQRILRSALIIWRTHWWPSFAVSGARMREHLALGYGFAFKNLLHCLQDNLDYIVIGKILGPSALGVYSLACKLTKNPTQKLWQIFGRMLFPAFAKFSDDRPRVVRNLYLTSRLIALAVLPAFGLIALCAASVIPWVLGPAWAEAAPVVVILMLFMALYGLSLPFESVLMATGRVAWMNWNKAIGLVAFAVAAVALRATIDLNQLTALFVSAGIAFCLATIYRALKDFELSAWQFIWQNLRYWLLTPLALFAAVAADSVTVHPLVPIVVYSLTVAALTLLSVLGSGTLRFKPLQLQFDSLAKP